MNCTLHRKRPVPSTVAALLVLAISLVLFFTTPLFALDKKPTGKNLADLRGTINRIQEGILQQENKRAETQTTERNILTELEILDKRLVSQQEKLATLDKKMHDQQVLIDQKENTLSKIRSEKHIVENHLQKRITAYYTMGSIGLLNVTFSTKSLPELLTFHDAFDSVIKYDQKVITDYRETIDQLVRVTTALDLEKAVLNDFIEQTVQEKEALQKTTTEKKTLLTHIQTEGKLHEQAIVEMQQASDAFAKSIVAIKSKSQVVQQKFLAEKGKLIPPVDGAVITLYHQVKANELGISSSSEGIAFKAPDGTKISAISDGDVTFSGYLRGFGNTVIIHHGFEYYTVTSRIEKILVEKGNKVKQGQNIGVMGDTATLFDEGLYFEIRHGRESQDPLLWLNPDRVTIVHERPPDQLGEDGSVRQ